MFRSARMAAGLSREHAAMDIHIGSRTLSDYEMSKSCTPPDVVLRMGEVYQDHTLSARYCKSNCPIGQVYAYEIEERDMSTSILKILSEFDNVRPKLNSLVAIGSDGIITKEEVPEFESILKVLFKLEHAIGTIKLKASSVVSIENLIQEHNKKEKAPAVASAR